MRRLILGIMAAGALGGISTAPAMAQGFGFPIWQPGYYDPNFGYDYYDYPPGYYVAPYYNNYRAYPPGWGYDGYQWNYYPGY